MDQNCNDLEKSFEKIAELYDEETKTFHHEISFYLTIQNILQELPKNRNLKILDSGGGTGKFTLYLNRLGYKVQLTDISSKSIDIAKEKAKKESIDILTQVCNSEETPFANDSFDFVMMNGGVISYTPDPIKLIREAYRILKPKGILWFDFLNSLGWAIETPDVTFKTQLALEKDKLIQMPDWDYPARVMSLDYVKQLLEQNSFRIKSQYGLVLLSNSLPLDKRYSKEYDQELLDTYKKIELELSRRTDCVGASWSCSICAIKE